MESSHRTKGLVRLTMSCNERCLFCNVPVEDYAVPTPPAAEIEAQVDDFVATGEQTMTISGGEPTLLRKRLLATVRSARERGVAFVELQTNAILVTPDYAAALAEAGLTSAFVSLLSDSGALHDELTALPGSFERCLDGIDNLHAAGVRVTLNPVVARTTQSRLVEYLTFVAARLPHVRSISLSCVQPHGRAHSDPELLPDYAVLREQVPRARAAAEAAGIELLNPYCGLPLCIGWSDDLERCVEAVEARSAGHAPLGLENRGDKSFGEPCRRCALRPWCGGAWHAYWRVRGGSGIAAPLTIREPWLGRAEMNEVVDARGGTTAETWSSLQAASGPTVWLHTDRLRAGDAAPIVASRCSDVALELDPSGLAEALPAARAQAEGLVALLREDRRVGRGIRVHLAMPRRRVAVEDLEAVTALAERLGLEKPVWLPAAHPS